MARQMKDSGIAWIGEMPEGWELQKGKYLYRQRSEKGNSIELQLLSPTQKYGVIPQSLYEKISGMKPVQLDAKADLEQFKSIYARDFCISLRSFQGGFEYSQYNGVVSPAYQVFYRQSDTTYDAFYRYIFKEMGFIGYMNSFTKSFRDGKSIAFDDFAGTLLPVPPIAEQHRIAAFLDRRCAEIDAVIERTKATIEEYKKLKQAVITEAVTKGVRGERKMKDSGIEWIGEIPEGWSRVKTLYALSMPITDGPHETPELFDSGVPFVSAEAVSCGKGSIDFDHIRGFISEEYYQECCKKYIPQRNDILMIKSGATTGRVSVVDTDVKFTIWSPLAVFRCKADIFSYRYLFYFLQSDGYQKQIENKWTFGTQQNIGMRTLEQLIVCYPPLGEQQEIAAYLDEKCAALDTLIAKKTALLTELEAYKKSLIYEYVTGKREVQ